MTRLVAGILAAALAGLVAARPAAAEPRPVRRLTHSGDFKQRPLRSPGGKDLLFTRHRGGKIALTILSDDAGERLLAADIPQHDACWSPDGKRIAFTRVAQTLGQGNLDVYIAQADGTEPVKLAGDEGKLSHEEYPAWSPDGRRIAYSSTVAGNQELYIADVEGGRRARLTSDPALDAHPAWTPDSRRVAFATSRWGDLEIAIVDDDGENLERLTHSPRLDDYPALSPDGRRLAFVSNRDGNYEVYVMRLEDRQAVNVTEHAAIDSYPSWTADGELLFVSNRDEGFDVYATTSE